MRNIIVPALAGFSLAVTATPAAAESLRATVSYDDLDLTSRAGMRKLERRVARAIDRMCGRDRRPIFTIEGERACLKQARASAAREIALATAEPTLALNARR